MSAVGIRGLTGLFLPGGLLLLAGLAFNQAPTFIPWRGLVVRIALVVVPLLGIMVGWRFNRFKPVLAIGLLLLVDRFLRVAPEAASSLISPDQLKALLAVFLPLNLVLLALGRERGLFSLSLALRIILILGQPLLVLYAAGHYPGVLALAEQPLLHDIPHLLGGLPQPGFVVYLLSLLLIGSLWGRRRDAVLAGFFWALIAAYAAQAQYSGLRSSICFTLGGLILLASIVEAAYSMAYKDELTGLPGRRALNELCLRLPGRYSIAMLDIDFFKKFNDTYGHDIGDQVLKMVAGKIGRVTGGGRPFRYGGEEFTVVFPRKNADECLEHLERLRKSVEFAEFVVRGQDRPVKKGRGKRGKVASSQQKVGVTISIGVATRVDRKTPVGVVMKAADEALYKAKKGGRNQVSQFS